MNLPKLLVFTSSYYPAIGGVENHVRAVTKSLKKHYAITILVRYADNIPAYQKVDEIEVYRLPKNLSKLSLATWSLFHWSAISGPQVIHSHDLFIYFFRRLFRDTYWVHTYHGFEGYPIKQAAIKSRQTVRDQVDYCFGIGQFIEKWYGTKCDEYLYGAADIARLKLARTKKWDGIFFGRLEPDTGFRAYLKAMVALEKSGDYRFAVIGDGSEMTWASNYCKTEHSNIAFLGKLPNVFDELGQAKVGFVSGYLGMIEAAALRLPIVAYYDNPLKHDYLTMHPQAKNLAITQNQAEIERAFVKSLKPSRAKLDQFQTWAKQQTWEKLAGKYQEAYAKAS